MKKDKAARDCGCLREAIGRFCNARRGQCNQPLRISWFGDTKIAVMYMEARKYRLVG